MNKVVDKEKIEKSIKIFYKTLLNRESDIKGLNYYTTQVMENSLTLDEVYDEMKNSIEASSIIKMSKLMESAITFQSNYSKEEIKNNGIEKKKTLEKQQEKKSQENNEFKEAIWLDIYKENENEFKEAFRGFMKKDSFRDKILEEFKNNEETLLTIQDLKEKSQTIFGRTPTILPLLSIRLLGILTELTTIREYIDRDNLLRS